MSDNRSEATATDRPSIAHPCKIPACSDLSCMIRKFQQSTYLPQYLLESATRFIETLAIYSNSVALAEQQHPWRVSR